MKPRIYLSGRMTGLADFNYPAFHAAAAAWRAAGWDVENPAEHFGGAQDRDYEEYVQEDIAQLQTCDAIAMLPGWNDAGARGSVWEWAVATKLLKLPAYQASVPVPPPEILGGAEILPVDYDEYREFKRWKQRLVIEADGETSIVTAAQPAPVDPKVAAFLDEVIPVTRHRVTGALGRWLDE